MPKRRVGLPEMVAREYRRLLVEQARLRAAALGPPPQTEEWSEAEQVRAWNRVDRSVDPNALLAQGVPLEEVLERVVPQRMAMLRRAGALSDRERVEWAEGMARRAEKARGAPGAAPAVAGPAPSPEPETEEPY